MRKIALLVALAFGLVGAATIERGDFVIATLYFDCGPDCTAFDSALSQADANEIDNLPARVTETLAVIKDMRGAPTEPKATTVATKLAKGPFDGAFDRVKAGKRSCSVYWYGFLDNASERVGTHQCRVSVKDGVVSVEKVTGDGFVATLRPFAGKVRAFAGRTYLADQPERKYDPDNPDNASNANFGNKVGLALTDRGRLYLIDISQRGFTEFDRSFFQVLVVE